MQKNEFPGFCTYARRSGRLYHPASIRMESHPAIISTRHRAISFAAACAIGFVMVNGQCIAENLAGTELSRRSAAIQEAQELLLKGDEAYLAGRYDQAIEAFAGARELIPDAPVSAELRAAATQRYAQACVEQARILSRNGDLAAAKATVDKALLESVAPKDPGALAMRAQLDDPIRTNPALTAEHATDVDQVRRLLYMAQAAFDLGKFDESNSHYRDVLRIDPTNTAARRGMEQISVAKSSYQQAAYDHTRAEMLNRVDAAWETRVPDLGVGPEDPGGLPGSTLESMTVAAKLDQIIIPKISLDQATLSEAIDFLRANTRKTNLTDNDSESINFTLNLGSADSENAIRLNKQTFDLRLSQVPLSEVLKYITSLTQTTYRTDDFSVIITPAGSASEELITRTYRVTPDFLTSISSRGGGADAAAPADPFAQDNGNAGLFTQRLSAQQAFTTQGIHFPDGASATYSPSTNTLRVINTATNQDIISQIVDAVGQTEPVSVSVRVTMIKTLQSNLEELSFDWLLSSFNLDSNNNLIGAGGTPGSTSGRIGADFTPTVPLPANPNATINSGVLTNGLRTGDLAQTANQLDALINNNTRAIQNPEVAPGILSLTGLFTDGQVQLLMRGLSQKKGTDVMARPSIVTRSGQAAKVLMVREFIYPTAYDPPELPSQVNIDQGQPPPVTPANPTDFEMKEVGISLDVTPVADANKRYVDITLNPSLTEFEGFVNYGSPIISTAQDVLGNTSPVLLTLNTILMPVFSIQKTESQLTVADGATIVIAGLMSDSIQKVQDKVPVLGDLPVVGRFFQSSVNKPVSTAIIFLVHVELLDPTGRPYRDR